MKRYIKFIKEDIDNIDPYGEENWGPEKYDDDPIINGIIKNSLEIGVEFVHGIPFWVDLLHQHNKEKGLWEIYDGGNNYKNFIGIVEGRSEIEASLMFCIKTENPEWYDYDLTIIKSTLESRARLARNLEVELFKWETKIGYLNEERYGKLNSVIE